MATWRKLHQKITHSLDFHALPDDFSRLVWVLLPLAMDSAGRCLDNTALVKARIMPLREDVSGDDMRRALDILAARGMIETYQVAGIGYFCLPKWEKYQGSASSRREGDAEFPGPSESEALRKSLSESATSSASESCLDVDVDVDVDKTSGASAPTDAPNPKADQDRIRSGLEQVFSDVTNIPLPKRETKAQKRSAGTRWWGPLREIAELVDWNPERAERLIRAACERMRRDSLTISAPQSILNVAIDLHAKSNGTDPPAAKPNVRIVPDADAAEWEAW